LSEPLTSKRGSIRTCLVVEVEQADDLFDLVADRQGAGDVELSLRSSRQVEEAPTSSATLFEDATKTDAAEALSHRLEAVQTVRRQALQSRGAAACRDLRRRLEGAGGRAQRHRSWSDLASPRFLRGKVLTPANRHLVMSSRFCAERAGSFAWGKHMGCAAEQLSAGIVAGGGWRSWPRREGARQRVSGWAGMNAHPCREIAVLSAARRWLDVPERIMAAKRVKCVSAQRTIRRAIQIQQLSVPRDQVPCYAPSTSCFKFLPGQALRMRVHVTAQKPPVPAVVEL